MGTAVLVGLLAGLSGALCGALVQPQADPAFLGRVTSVPSIVSLGLAPLSMPLFAAAVGLWGTGPVFVVSAAVCGLGGVIALGVRHLRRAELPPLRRPGHPRPPRSPEPSAAPEPRHP